MKKQMPEEGVKRMHAAGAKRLGSLMPRLRWYAALVIAPLWIVQGLWVRMRILRLPEADGPQFGEVGRGSSCLRIAVIGESPVAGVGARTQAEGLAAQTAAALANDLGARVHWRAFGKNGAMARTTLETLVPDFCSALQRAPVDLLVVALGVNDTTHLTSLRAFSQHWQGLLQVLRQQTAAPILVTAVPPMGVFPALPQPLRAVFGLRSAMLDARLQLLLCADANVHHVAMEFDVQHAQKMAADGFHPSPLGYQEWGAHIANRAAPLLAANICRAEGMCAEGMRAKRMRAEG